MCVSEITWKIEFTRTRYNFIAKLASSWTINTLITGYTIIVYKVNQFMYVKTNKKCLYIVFELCEFYDEEFYEKINVYLCLFLFDDSLSVRTQRYALYNWSIFFLLTKPKMFIEKMLLEITSELPKNQQLIIDLWDI